MESEQESELVDWITEAGGDIVSIEEKNEIDYLITGLRHNLSKSFSMVPRAVLTHLWLDDCFDDGKLVPVLYYHQPITIDLSLKPCEGAVIGISNYSGRERTYIRLVFIVLKRQLKVAFIQKVLIHFSYP